MYIGGWPWYIPPTGLGRLGSNKLLPVRDETSPTPLHEPSQRTIHDKHYLLMVTIWAFVVVTGRGGCGVCCGGLRGREPRWATSCRILFRVGYVHGLYPRSWKKSTSKPYEANTGLRVKVLRLASLSGQPMGVINRTASLRFGRLNSHMASSDGLWGSVLESLSTIPSVRSKRRFGQCEPPDEKRVGRTAFPAPAHEANQDREANYASQSYSHVRRTPGASTTSQISGELRSGRKNAKQTTLGKFARSPDHNPCHLCHNGKACCAINHRDRNLTGNKMARTNQTVKRV